MNAFTKIAAVALTSLTLSAALVPTAEAAPWRHRHHGGAIAAGLIGGALLGAAAYGATRPAYAAPVYAEEECYRTRVGYNHYGRPIYRTVCE